MMNRKLKILFLSTGTGVGGGETQVTAVGTRLKARGHEVMIVSMSEIGFLGEKARASGLLVESLGMRRGASLLAAPRAAIRMLGILRRWKPDILVSFMFYANLLGRCAGFVARVPVNITSIRSERFGGVLHHAVIRLTDGLGDMTVTNSDRVGRVLAERAITARERLRVVPNGICIEKFEHDNLARDRILGLLFPGRDVDFLWLALGRLHEAKGYPFLLHAFSRLCGSVPGAYLLIAGDGPQANTLKELANNLGIADKVCFAGERDDVPHLLSAADSLVLSSIWEGLPNAVMEAMASGLPVVATDVGGVRELLGDNAHGFVVPPGVPDSLAAAMKQMMSLSAADRVEIGRAAQKHVTNRYELERVTETWERLFFDLLGCPC